MAHSTRQLFAGIALSLAIVATASVGARMLQGQVASAADTSTVACVQ